MLTSPFHTPLRGEESFCLVLKSRVYQELYGTEEYVHATFLRSGNQKEADFKYFTATLAWFREWGGEILPRANRGHWESEESVSGNPHTPRPSLLFLMEDTGVA